MPTYEYACPKCKQEFSFIRSIHSIEEAAKCATCDIALQRIFSPFGVVFRGGGFYKNDNRS